MYTTINTSEQMFSPYLSTGTPCKTYGEDITSPGMLLKAEGEYGMLTGLT